MVNKRMSRVDAEIQRALAEIITRFDDVQFVINYLKEGESVVLNLNNMNEYDSQRLLDCTYGAIYALNGSIQRVENNIFLLMPEGYNIRTHEQKPQQ